MLHNRHFRPGPVAFPTQVSRFVSRNLLDSSSKKMSKAKQKSYVDPMLLENATEAVLKIVHRGSSRKALEARERERERIKEHVLRIMKPDDRKECFQTRCLPETSEKMANRKRLREERKMSVEPKPKIQMHRKEEKKPVDETIDHFSFLSPCEITGFADLTKGPGPSCKKQVSFYSPAKPLSPFRTPTRPSQSNFSKPPPLLKQKRGTVVVDASDDPSGFKFNFDEASGAPESSEDPARVPYDLLGIGITESSSRRFSMF